MGLGQGWLSESHEFFYALTAKEMAIHRALSKLPSEVKLNLAAIISALSSDESST